MPDQKTDTAMAIQKIKRGKWSRQLHLVNASARAGLGWASDQISTLGMATDEREKARDQLMNKQAENWVLQLGQLKGSIVKIGQIVATYADYCLPAPLALALHKLEADTDPLTWSAIHPYIQKSLKELEHELIIEPIALAAASLSQVHRARVKEDCRTLCLKILYPDIAKTLDSDLAVLEKGLGLWLKKGQQQQFSLWISSIHDVMSDEMDLKQEAKKLKKWAKILEHDQRYVVPTVDDKYCSKDILAMSFESGIAQHDESINFLSQERRNALAKNMLELFFREVMLWGEMQTDPHPGNYRIRLNDGGDKIVLLDFGSVRKIGKALLPALRSMIISAYKSDRSALLEAVMSVGLLDQSAPIEVQHAFSDVLLGLVEPLNYKARMAADPDSIPDYAVDNQLNYCWADANLPKRMGKLAVKSAFSQFFSFPGADFLLLSRKLAGVYAFIAALDARFDGGAIVEKIISEMPDTK
jgi:predicted unusual protein kinase regulating ubiquinone biosynthesis (AarF/ABC1/UbiB family)